MHWNQHEHGIELTSCFFLRLCEKRCGWRLEGGVRIGIGYEFGKVDPEVRGNQGARAGSLRGLETFLGTEYGGGRRRKKRTGTPGP